MSFFRIRNEFLVYVLMSLVLSSSQSCKFFFCSFFEPLDGFLHFFWEMKWFQKNLEQMRGFKNSMCEFLRIWWAFPSKGGVDFSGRFRLSYIFRYSSICIALLFLDVNYFKEN